MNRILLGINILLLLGLAGLYYLHFNQNPDWVYVNSSKLINEYQGMQNARAAFQQKSLIWRVNVDSLTVEVQEAIKQYEKESRSMTAKEKELNQQLLRTKQQQLVTYQKAIQEQAQQEDTQMTLEVVSEINNYLASYGKANNYQIIFAATDAGNIAYAEESIDVTKEVLVGLNKQYRGE